MQQRRVNKAVGTEYIPAGNRNSYFDITVPPPQLSVIENRYYGKKAKLRAVKRERLACRILLPVTVLVAAGCVSALIFLSAGISAHDKQLYSMNQRSNMLSVEYDNYESMLASVTYPDTVAGIAENNFGMYIPEH